MARYFRVFLLAPFVLAVIGGTVPLLRDIGLLQMTIAAMFAGGIPYLIFVVCALIWSIKQGNVNHTKAFILSPFVFGLFCFVYGLVLAYTDLSKSPHLFVGLGFASTYAVFGILVSAVYSWSAMGTWWLFSCFRKTV